MILNTQDRTEAGVTWLALFTTTGTLVCCALPITLVSLGLGATLASLLTAAPFLVTLSQQKLWVFSISGALLGVSGWLMYRPGRACPVDPELGRMCSRTQRWNRRIFWVSVALWCLGFSAAYLALPIYQWFEG